MGSNTTKLVVVLPAVLLFGLLGLFTAPVHAQSFTYDNLVTDITVSGCDLIVSISGRQLNGGTPDSTPFNLRPYQIYDTMPLAPVEYITPSSGNFSHNFTLINSCNNSYNVSWYNTSYSIFIVGHSYSPPTPTPTPTTPPTPTPTATPPPGWQFVETRTYTGTGSAVGGLPEIPNPYTVPPLTDELQTMLNYFWQTEWVSKAVSMAMSIPLLVANYKIIQTLLIASAIIFVIRWWLGRGTHTAPAGAVASDLPPEARKRR